MWYISGSSDEQLERFAIPIKVLFNKTHYRLFAFWDKTEKTVVISTHGIIKKTDKTPLNELEKAEKIRNMYFKLKE